ncbi:MAG: Unknown, probable insecticidal toxin [uncultured Paraburkholderia sp.]|nr:MAG: Unknown, probable insecticidal toxin [uncultured Paraburkholderia sp.]
MRYLDGSDDGKDDANIVTNLRASQQIALSSGPNDAGLFELNFGDERYLPFEGTGAVSGWTLKFPRPTSDAQKAALDSLVDVIVHVRYTAFDGGDAFAQAVGDTDSRGEVSRCQAISAAMTPPRSSSRSWRCPKAAARSVDWARA